MAPSLRSRCFQSAILPSAAQLLQATFKCMLFSSFVVVGLTAPLSSPEAGLHLVL